jgi:hypothetical protein
MKKTILAGLVTAAALVGSSAAMAHVDVSVGLGFPATIYQAPPVVYVPPGVVAYSDPYYRYDDVDWRERRWREHGWHRGEWRGHGWRDHDGHGRHGRRDD